MRKFNKNTLALITSVALATAFSGQAHAGAKAFSALSIDNFIITNAGTGVQMDATNFDVLALGNSSTAGATLSGQQGITAAAFAPPDVLLQCLDADGGITCGGIAQNDFTQQPLGANNETGHFSRGDSLLTGAIISGLGGQDFATADAVSGVQLNQTADATANSFVGTTTNFSFTLGNDTALGFSFDAAGLLHAILHQDENFVLAEYSFNIEIDELVNGVSVGTVFDWAPDGIDGNNSNGTDIDGFDLQASAGLLGTGDTGPLGLAGTFTAQTGVLLADTSYQLRILHSTDVAASAVKVPEPATLAIFGMAVMGLAASRRRKPSRTA